MGVLVMRDDQEQQEAEALQALMTIAAAGFCEEAETLAVVCGLHDLWHQPIKERMQ